MRVFARRLLKRVAVDALLAEARLGSTGVGVAITDTRGKLRSVAVILLVLDGIRVRGLLIAGSNNVWLALIDS